MKRHAPIWIGLVLVAGILPLYSANKRPEIQVFGPTVVAFFPPVIESNLSKDANSNETLADFQLYAGQVRAPLKERGVEFHVVYARSFSIRTGKSAETFKPKKVDVGYYLVSPGKKPRIEYGVMTDTDLLQVADEYFGTKASS